MEFGQIKKFTKNLIYLLLMALIKPWLAQTGSCSLMLEPK